MTIIRTSRLTIATAVAASLCSAPILAQAVGVNSAVKNQVTMKQTRSAASIPAKVKQRVALGNQVSTGAASALQVTLLDRTSVTVGPNAQMTIDKFVYDPSKKSSSVSASVAKGTFRFLSGKTLKGGSNSINTPAASIGIRGTMVEGAVGQDAMTIAAQQPDLPGLAGSDPETASIVTLRGPGPGAPPSETVGRIDVTSGGRTVTLTRPGQSAFIPRSGAAPIQFNLSTPGYTAFDMALRTAPAAFAPPFALAQPTVGLAKPSPVAGAATPGQTIGTAQAAGTTSAGVAAKSGVSGVLLAVGAAIAALVVALAASGGGGGASNGPISV